MPSDDVLQALVLSCLERVENLLNDLDRLASDPNRHQQRQQIQADMRRELEATEKAFRANHGPM
jgi:hypothetical protein